MSYFSGENQNTVDQNNQQQQQQTQNQQEDYVAKLVQAKGDTWGDIQVIAKGKLESDEFISNLEKQNEELRAELDKQDYASELLKQLQSKNNETPPAGNQTGVQGSTKQENTTPQFSEDELKALVKSTLESTNAEAVKEGNLKAVDAKLNELYGTEVDKVMEKRSADLGMTKERLQELAAESPSAFMTLIGEEVKQESNPVTKGTINTSTDSFTMQTGERDWTYYQDLRRKDRKTYFTPAVQKQMMQDKLRLGDKFGN